MIRPHSEWPRYIRGWALGLLLLAALPSAIAQSDPRSDKPIAGPLPPRAAPPVIHLTPQVVIPRLQQAPKLEDFLAMRPDSEAAHAMAKVEKFTQREPQDGAPASQKTEAYIGYTDKNLYVVFVCFDSEPGKVRAHLARRENISDDDGVRIVLDTFHDRRRAYVLSVNPLGIQSDWIFTDDTGSDYSWDTLWNSSGKLTPEGYVTWMEIPFRSLRFPAAPEQLWGIVFARQITRSNEQSYWPPVSARIQDRLPQAADGGGMRGISPGRNLQFIPYGVFTAFRGLDDRDPNFPHFTSATFRGRLGLDAKLVIKDSFVLDLTANPDFSQVESDEPQTTVNQRFEVFFPEKRPFFQENSNYFDTQLPLVFTRRIAAPKFGARLTGKAGPWSVGYFGIDDTSPGKVLPDGDAMAGKRAFFNILRVNREMKKGSSIGIIYTDRELACHNRARSLNSGETGFNRVGGLDYRWKINRNWKAQGQAVGSATKFVNGTGSAGHAVEQFVAYSSRKIEFNSFFADHGADFLTRPGFFVRPDFRRFSNFFLYTFRPEGKRLVSHGPSVFQLNTWDHHGTVLDNFWNANYRWEFKRQTSFGFFGNAGTETLRPSDFSALPANRAFDRGHRGFFFYTLFFQQLSANGEIGWGTATNFLPRTGPPVSTHEQYANLVVTVRPMKQLSIDNTYLLDRLSDLHTHANVFNSHILRSKWNYQVTKELSLRFIAQYNAVLANPALTSSQTSKRANADFLITWLLHPGTAVYVGYNSNLQNLDRSLGLDPDGNLLRTRSRFLNDGRQIFVKVSYLFRY